MSIRTVKVCEECGRQTTDGDSWLVISNVDIREAGSRTSLVHSAGVDLDICSPGCLLRYIAKSLDDAQAFHISQRRQVDRARAQSTGVAA